MTWTYQAEYVKCGKGCRSCPHGPYWYRYRKANRRTVKQYVGKVHPEQENPAFPQAWAERDTRADILDRDKANLTLAYSILGIPTNATQFQAQRIWRSLCMVHHPDRGGDASEFVLIGAAWSYLCSFMDWR